MSPRPHTIVRRGLAGLRRVLSSVNTTGPPPRLPGMPSFPPAPPQPRLFVFLLQTPLKSQSWDGSTMPPRCTCSQDRWGVGQSLECQVLLVVLGWGLAVCIPCCISRGELLQVSCARELLRLSLASEVGLYLFPILSVSEGMR